MLHITLSRKYRLNQPWDTTIHLLGRPQIGNNDPNIGEVGEKLGTLISLVAMQNGIATLKTLWQFVIKLNILLPLRKHVTTRSNNHTPGISKRVQNLSLHIIVHKDVSSSLIHNHQILKQPRCPSRGEWINKLWCMPVVDYSVQKRNELLSHKRHGSNCTWVLLRQRN